MGDNLFFEQASYFDGKLFLSWRLKFYEAVNPVLPSSFSHLQYTVETGNLH